MKKTKFILTFLIFLSITLAIIPTAIPQTKHGYTFHGAAGNQKILKIVTSDDDRLEDVLGPTGIAIIEFSFGTGALNEGFRKKSLVTAVDYNVQLNLTAYGLGMEDAVNYTTSNWNWYSGSFPEDPDSTGDIVTSIYDPSVLNTYINALFSGYFNVSAHTAGYYLAQLPTPVPNYLAEINWDNKWENVDNKMIHHAEAGDSIGFTVYLYQEDCTETWTYDTTYGAWIGYKLEDNESTTIYEFDIELPGGAEIPGYELPIILSVSTGIIITLIYVVIKKKK